MSGAWLDDDGHPNTLIDEPIAWAEEAPGLPAPDPDDEWEIVIPDLGALLAALDKEVAP